MTEKQIIQPTEFRYKPRIEEAHGHYVCTECGAEYYPGVGKPFHKGICNSKAWAYVFGPKEKKAVMEMGFSP